MSSYATHLSLAPSEYTPRLQADGHTSVVSNDQHTAENCLSSDRLLGDLPSPRPTYSASDFFEGAHDVQSFSEPSSVASHVSYSSESSDTPRPWVASSRDTQPLQRNVRFAESPLVNATIHPLQLQNTSIPTSDVTHDAHGNQSHTDIAGNLTTMHPNGTRTLYIANGPVVHTGTDHQFIMHTNTNWERQYFNGNFQKQHPNGNYESFVDGQHVTRLPNTGMTVTQNGEGAIFMNHPDGTVLRWQGNHKLELIHEGSDLNKAIQAYTSQGYAITQNGIKRGNPRPIFYL